jgi:hypothetical protein
LAADEISDMAFIVVERREHEQIHEWRTVATVIEDRFCDFLPSSYSIYHPPHAGIGRFGALKEATISADNVFTTVLGDVVEFCNACQCMVF